MVKRILLSTAMLLALATTSWAQGSGCSSCDANSGGYIDDVAYSSEVIEGCDCASSTCGVGQGYFSNVDSGCGTNYKYTRLFGGLGYVDDDDLGGGLLSLDYDDGWGAGISFGRRIGRIRLDKEFSYRHNSLDVDFAGSGSPIANGNLSTTASMVNLMVDFLKIGKSTLYTGGGIGAIYGDIHLVSAPAAAVDDTAFAYQGIFGVDRELRNGMKGFVEYRYLAAEFEFDADGDFDYDAQNLFFGVEFRR